MKILAYTDGASRGNPGESGIGIVLKDENNNVLESKYGYIGQTTNNVAEYTALTTCLKIVGKMNCTDLIAHSDSELMVRQLNGIYKVKDDGLKKHFQNIKKILNDSSYQFTIKYIPREDNQEADRLANIGIDSKKQLTI